MADSTLKGINPKFSFIEQFIRVISKQPVKEKVIMCSIIYWAPKETIQSSLLYYFIRCDNMTFLHLVKVVRDVFEYKCQILILFSEAKLL